MQLTGSLKTDILSETLLFCLVCLRLVPKRLTGVIGTEYEVSHAGSGVRAPALW